MKYLADENVARRIVEWLRLRGHDILYASEKSAGSTDEQWLTVAENEKRLILTSDKDFGELVFRDKLNSHGVVLMRLERLSIDSRLQRMEQVWAQVEENPCGHFIVITPRKFRIRPLAS